jgi:hypothetical protein
MDHFNALKGRKGKGEKAMNWLHFGVLFGGHIYLLFSLSKLSKALSRAIFV